MQGGLATPTSPLQYPEWAPELIRPVHAVSVEIVPGGIPGVDHFLPYKQPHSKQGRKFAVIGVEREKFSVP